MNELGGFFYQILVFYLIIANMINVSTDTDISDNITYLK